MAEPSTAPRPDVVEFSAFGPGYGECLLVHLGAGEWMIVDSCEDPDGHQPALDWLDAMHVDPAAVKLVVATHWHDDHVRGIAKVLAACPNAGFSCSVALRRDELVAAIGGVSPALGGKLTSGVAEMQRVFGLLTKQRPPIQPQWALQDRLLHRRLETPDVPGCEVYVLAPRDKVLLDAYRSIAPLVADGLQGERVRRPDRNLAAVVLWVEIGDATLLLGSDLQEKPGRWWTAVVDCRRGKERQGDIFKVPHHGSQNAHLPAVWEKILVARPEAVVCPWQNGGSHLPTPTDLARLCDLATVHLTAPPKPSGVFMKGHPMRQSVSGVGRVTLRRRSGADPAWSVSYGGAASKCVAPPVAGAAAALES